MIRRVDVTAEDIAQGEPRKCVKCPIALALRRTLEQSLVGVGGHDAVMVGKHGVTSVELPSMAVRFIADFDDGKPVQPFSFALDLPR